MKVGDDQKTLQGPPSPLADCVVMSLRGSEATEAISQDAGETEIAALPPVARNDNGGITTQPLGGEGQGEGLAPLSSLLTLSHPTFFHPL
jgi:hypothetical protein